jgi:5-methylcytosine-specific restriction enzyme A
MSRLTNLKNRVATLDTRVVPTMQVVHQGSTRRIRGSTGVQRRIDYLKQYPLCAHCKAKGRATAALQVDHIKPLWAGGKDEDSNKQGLCIPCHKAKSAAEAADRYKAGT